MDHRRSMNLERTYQSASERHRESGRRAQAAHCLYAAALHERSAEILDAEVAWCPPSASAVLRPSRTPPARGWSMTGAGLRLQSTL